MGLYVGSGQSADMPRVAVAWPVSIRRADCAVCGRYVARSSAPDVPTMVPATPPARCVPPHPQRAGVFASRADWATVSPWPGAIIIR